MSPIRSAQTSKLDRIRQMMLANAPSAPVPTAVQDPMRNLFSLNTVAGKNPYSLDDSSYLYLSSTLNATSLYPRTQKQPDLLIPGGALKGNLYTTIDNQEVKQSQSDSDDEGAIKPTK